MPDFGAFHFLRPWWLLVLPATAFLFVVVSRRDDPVRPWRDVIDPELLSHLVVGEARAGTFRPVHLLTAILVLSALALAGPTWEREVPPIDADRAPVVIALDVSASMNRDDVAPSRLERAKQKARDLVAARAGARTGLVAYAGTAHTVLPPTDDPDIPAHYVAALSTDVMPVAGKNASSALARARALLAGEERPGAVVFLTDGIEARDHGAMASAGEEGVEVYALAVGPARGLAPVEDVVDVVDLTVDDSDVNEIAQGVRDSTGAIESVDGATRWKDFGFYLLYPIVGLALLGFRKGFGLRWGAAVFACGIVAAPAPASAFTFADLWLTPDQQGRYWFDRGDYERAAELFVDPFWRGAACYRADDLECATDAWSNLESPEALYDIGNAWARRGQDAAAIAAYERALAARPGWRDAEFNLALVKKRRDQPSDEEAPPPTFDADDVRFDDDENTGTRGEVDLPGLSDEQIGALWLRGLKSDPADFLRLKFAFQDEANERARAAGGAGR